MIPNYIARVEKLKREIKEMSAGKKKILNNFLGKK